MGTLFASTLRALVREKSLFIWSLAFPILMATIFMFMFANLDGAMEFDPVPTGVVADEAWDTSPFSAVAEALGKGATISCWTCAASPMGRRPHRPSSTAR